MRMRIAWLWLLLALIGCAPVSAEPAAWVSVRNNALDTVYGFSVTIANGEDVRGTQAMRNADGSALAAGEEVRFTFTADELAAMGLSDGQTAAVSVSVATEPGDEADAAAVGQADVALTIGQGRTFSVTGSAQDGFSLTAD